MIQLNLLKWAAPKLTFDSNRPISRALIEQPLWGLIFGLSLLACVPIVANFDNLRTVFPNLVSVQYAMTQACIFIAVGICGLAYCKSFSHFFWFVCASTALTTCHLILAVTNSTILFAILGTTFLLLGLLNSSSAGNGWSHIRIGILIAGVFIGLGKHVFSYSLGIYEWQPFGLSLFGAKDLLTVLIGILILGTSLIEVAIQMERERFCPPVPRFFSRWRRKIQSVWNGTSPLAFQGTTFAARCASSAYLAKKLILKWIAWLIDYTIFSVLEFIINAVSIIVIVAWRTIATSARMFSMKFIRSTIATILPVTVSTFIVVLSLYLASLLSIYPVTTEFLPPGGLAILMSFLAVGIFLNSIAFHLFPLADPDDNPERTYLSQGFDRMLFATLIVVFLLAIVSLVTQGIKHWRIDGPSLLCLIVPVAALVLFSHLYRAGSHSENPSNLGEALQSSRKRIDGIFAVLPCLLFLASSIVLPFYGWAMLSGLQLIIGGAAMTIDLHQKRMLPLIVMGLVLGCIGVLTWPQMGLRVPIFQRSVVSPLIGPELDLFGLGKIRRDFDAMGYNAPF